MESIYARRVSISGPTGAVSDRQLETAASLFRHFSRQRGHLGGDVLVADDRSKFCATSYWDSREAVAATMNKARGAAENTAVSLWGDRGRVEIETFEAWALVPCPVPVAIPGD